jgi:serine/threonine protein kinase
LRPSSPSATEKRILAGKLNKFPRTVSSAAKDFVRSCVTLDPAQRMTASEALEHPWMKIATVFDSRDLPGAGSACSSELDDSTFGSPIETTRSNSNSAALESRVSL